MKKLIVIGIIILLVGMSVPSTGINVEKTSITSFDGNTIYVGGSGIGNYSTIQDALDVANDLDTIYVFKGKYLESLVIDKSINLIGEERDITVIDGSLNDDIEVRCLRAICR